MIPRHALFRWSAKGQAPDLKRLTAVGPAVGLKGPNGHRKARSGRGGDAAVDLERFLGAEEGLPMGLLVDETVGDHM